MAVIRIYASETDHPISDAYPNDSGIENDPDVLYVEKFDDDISVVLNRYTNILNKEGIFLDADIPQEGLSGKSLKIVSVGQKDSGGRLFKKITPGYDSVVYLRYYVKYPMIAKGYIHHSSVSLGGYNPPSDYGNDFINGSPTAKELTWDKWMCIEVMVKLNNPVAAYNGELRIWQDGVEIGHWGPGFPNGHWAKDSWINFPADPPFQGFRRRTTPDLDINYLRIEHYDDTSPLNESCYVLYDNIVIAKNYIGPIKR